MVGYFQAVGSELICWKYTHNTVQIWVCVLGEVTCYILKVLKLSWYFKCSMSLCELLCLAVSTQNQVISVSRLRQKLSEHANTDTEPLPFISLVVFLFLHDRLALHMVALECVTRRPGVSSAPICSLSARESSWSPCSLLLWHSMHWYGNSMVKWHWF